jgi:hypothetical protein
MILLSSLDLLNKKYGQLSSRKLLARKDKWYGIPFINSIYGNELTPKFKNPMI